MKNILKLPSLFVFLFMTVFLPFYGYYGNENILQIRNIYYLISLLIASILAFLFLLQARAKSRVFIWLAFAVFIFFSWTLLQLIISYMHLSVPKSDSDIVQLSYCFLAFIFSISFTKNLNSKYFVFLLFIIWLIICYFVVSKIDIKIFQSVYGENDPKFAGVYQYIGDTFAFVSISITAKILTTGNCIKFNIIKNKLNNSKQISKQIYATLLLFISLIILFFNSSRASLVSFIIVIPYMFYCLFNRWSNLKKIIMFSLVAILFILVYAYYVNNLQNLVSDSNLLSNRNLSSIETGSDASLNERIYYYELGIQDIITNPIFGNYPERVIHRGNGTYIHNLLATFQDFGFIAFFSYVSLLAFCVNQFYKSWNLVNDCECVIFNSLLIFNIVQILMFRHPLGFYIMFINFGMAMNLLTQKQSIFSKK